MLGLRKKTARKLAPRKLAPTDTTMPILVLVR